MEQVNAAETMEPNEAEEKTFTKTSGFANMTGELYEVKMLALMFLRALHTNLDFCLASNMKSAGCFDDIVFRSGERTVFLQLKHKDKRKTKIKLSQLVHDKNFNLLKYFKSCHEIKQQWDEDEDLKHCGKFEDSLFVIYTNSVFVEGLGSIVNNSDLLKIVRTGGKCICFTNLLENLTKYKDILCEAIDSNIPTFPQKLFQCVKNLGYGNTSTIPSKTVLRRLLCDLETLGDLSEYQQFFSCLFFCSEQAIEEQLDDLIKQEIKMVCGTDIAFSQFIEGMQAWWRHSDTYLTANTQFWQDIIEICAASIAQKKFEDILKLNVKFRECVCKDFKSKLSHNETVFIIETNCTRLTCLKVLQSLNTKLVVDYDILHNNLTAVLAVWKLGIWGDILIVEGGIPRNAFLKLNGLFRMHPQKELIVILSKFDVKEMYNQLEIDVFTDSFQLNQLDSESQERALKCQVNFQGFPVSLSMLGNESTLHKAVTADIVIELLTGEQKLKVGHKLNKPDKCYIPRVLKRSEYINKQIFSNLNYEKVCLSGVTEAEMEMAITDETGKKRLRTWPILIKNPDDYYNYCKISDTVHWIHKCDEGFVWEHSKGNFSFIKSFLTSGTVTYNSTMETLRCPHPVVLILAEPGMGKSTETSQFAMTVKDNDPTKWVVTVYLNDHVAFLSQNESSIIELLLEAGKFNTDFQKHLFKDQILYHGNVIVLFDGFDEISPDYAEKVILMIKELIEVKNIKVWVTSRLLMKDKLEQELKTLPFEFMPFTEDNKKEFLLKFWKIQEKDYNLNTFVCKLLKLSEICDSLMNFTGIPLQLRMLAEVFASEASHYVETGDITLPLKFDLLKLYKMFVDKKWEIYFNRMGVNISKVGLSKDYQKLRAMFEQKLMCCAVFSMLGSYKVRKLKNASFVQQECEEYISEFKTGNNRIGIISEVINDKPRFVHRTFAEFYMAKFFSEFFFMQTSANKTLNIYNRCCDSIMKLFGRKEIKRFYRDEVFYRFRVVRNFFDRILAENFDLHVAVLNLDKILAENLLLRQKINVNGLDLSGRTPLHLALANFSGVQCVNYFDENFEIGKEEEMLSLLLEQGANVNTEDKVSGKRPLNLAVAIEAWPAVGLLLEKGANMKDLVLVKGKINDKDFLLKLLSLAVRKGFYNLIAYLLNKGVNVEEKINVRKYSQVTMLHIAADLGQLKMVKLLLQNKANPNVRSGEVPLKTPLICASENGLVQVAELLIKNGADIELYNQFSQNALLIAAHKGHSDMISMLLNYQANLLSHDNRGNSALHLAADAGNADCVELLLDAGLTTDIVNHDSETPLMSAAKRGHCTVIEIFLRHGANFKACDKTGNTVLHHAVRSCNVECLSLLLSMEHDININACNTKNETPLILTSQIGNYDVMNFLIQQNATLTACDIYGNTGLHYTASYGNIECMSLLLDSGVDINCRNLNGETPLMRTVSRKTTEALRFLYDHGADLHIRDKRGWTALHEAAKWCTPAVKWLVQHGADPTALDNSGNMPLNIVKQATLHPPKVYNRTERIVATIKYLEKHTVLENKM
ncbi:hypothetical protein C0J52_10325 [Blattella germanica]|nr:hypothetical protein C0J52_10325 [Blattella germanica]PSN47947.1 hypothetical protein C0J52_10325 [Blattella germanica]PSN47948.1 hypothetical protein C0J52_10325 [Blattella germanica]